MKIEICTDIEIGNMTIHATVFFDYYPGEPEVRYYPDGSGYPGSPAECEYTGVLVDAVTGDNYAIQGSEKTDWFQLLDWIVDDIIQENKHGLRDRLEEDAIYEWEDAYEDF